MSSMLEQITVSRVRTLKLYGGRGHASLVRDKRLVPDILEFFQDCLITWVWTSFSGFRNIMALLTQPLGKSVTRARVN